ncbi:TetR family transcriptional regulator [Pelovirga terrestris]|uniref:TetR family transcriptional regulator n=1 Tax=Pelovirga terrestris TaxID=2771352 RepID=A0A8J6QXS8_9BACT|nr:TetR family transcriptional regulator [Pelovirga terrestris]MBD1401046.1 TetR family transcriptional regulator [Pelovirga terrestris]
MRRSKEDAQQTRKKIVAAAEEVFFHQGIARTTLEQIARAAGVTRGAIYWNFANKVDLINAVHAEIQLPAEEILKRILADDTSDALDRLEKYCTDSLLQLYTDEHIRRVYSIVLLKCELSEETRLLNERLRESKLEMTHNLERFFTRLQQHGYIDPAEEPRLLALGLYSFMLGVYGDYLRYPDFYQMPGDAAKMVQRFFVPLR